ncbi:MalY/PatB family protein [Thiomicrorhabdus indica]|uniref:MalY/PatB family protein n=1 Tax=Thiomicrorhabdus indica TaxID=2267253 RepID=UPI00102E0133|nr:PatB family C-S lyase [Thiomicrorhabdus indica]
MDNTEWQIPLSTEQISHAHLTYFDRPVNRENTFSEKYDLRETLFGTKDVIPMWVADMDLPTAPFIIDALKQRLDHSLLGYNLMPNTALEAIIDWQAQHNYTVHTKEICFTHNVANGFHLAVQAVTEPKDSVLVMTPVYPPFMQAAEKTGRKTVCLPLLETHTDSVIDYQMDFENLEKSFSSDNIKALLFCHPHNPVGRVWSKQELLKLSQLCLDYGVVIISDEIHSDLVLTGRHIPIASLSEEVAQKTITLSSPGKTFNLGGLQIGYAIIANPYLRKQFEKASQSVSIHDLNTFALHALIAAYSPAGNNWTLALLEHIKNNFNQLQIFLKQYAPEIKINRAQATYLVWLDFSAWGWPQNQLKDWLVKEAKLGLSNGDSFFPKQIRDTSKMRMNLAVSTETMQNALKQLQLALEKRTIE